MPVEYWWSNPSYPRDRAIVPGTDEVIRAGSAEQVYELWKPRCDALGLKFNNPLAAFSDACCKALSVSQRAEACRPMSDAAPEFIRQERLIGWSDVKAFFAKVWAWGKAWRCVSQEEADRRAAICATCPLNQKAYLPGCPGCSNIAAQIFQAIGDRHTSSDAGLQSCGHCGCQNKVIVWAPLEVLVANETELPSPPEWCWKRA